ncbi:FecCD family ABC transporter permease [Parapusillimonas granuli]|uniref:Iron ABC transporter permease n=1 Tax=Parapusillimonas granuli TaxID=380911 RepID=A0A853FTJ7_9BURK|nr:iron ABC transporter permease [Parapusillimonas granuli]MBB5214893.1 iron complex transport system permease protein [Parapusillimonas granuli]MEB2399911.1 iron ABC transporter permease [Alcaligenaceae bacterium]NYT49215.1 iron ABC transporter permease [Parapusillimonas granuli]
MLSESRKLAPQPILLILLLCLALAMLAASASGAVYIPWSSFPRLLWGSLSPGEDLLHRVLMDIRLPRVLFSTVAGAALAATGVTMQALFRNPLAEPGLVGISAGAALGAVSAIVMTAGGFLTVAGFAFLGSLAATFLAYSIGRRYSGVAGLLLAGIAINTIAGSAIGVFTYLADDAQLRDLTFWNMGSLAGANWSTLAWLGPWTLLLMAYLCGQWRVLNALLLGEREAAHLGFELAVVRRRLIVVTALVIGPLVAVTGGIGFIGLVVPHLIRMLLGAHHRYLMPASMVAGGLLLTLADWLARLLVSPAELPIGLVTSLVGGPFFFFLLARGRAGSH